MSDRPSGSAKGAALRLLGRRDYTAAELTRKLAHRGYPADEIASTIEALSAAGAIDDRRAALAHTRTAAGVKARGPLRIRRELQARGVSADLIREATSDLTDEEVARAIEHFLKRRRVMRPIPREARPRLFQQLLRRGFPGRLVAKALGGIEGGDE